MSVARSRSGGTEIRITSSLKRRSALNLPPSTSCSSDAIGRRDDARVNAARQVFPDSPHLAVLQHAQQLGLSASGQLPYFVQEQSPAVGFLEETRPLSHGARERAAGMTEELRFDEFVRDGRAVDRAEAPVPPRAEPMDRSRHELFAAAALAKNQDGKRRSSGVEDRVPKLGG